ncbi:MAG: glucose-1-phosphate adenylyltransferase, partial [Lachnospiraceae bacterium]|nr:glucose-1-phosphate adenylyltransferase [Lachnospiraceae bacterium]
NTLIGAGCRLNRAIVAEEVIIGDRSILGVGEHVPNRENPKVYSFGLVTVGENSVIPPDVQIGFNTAVSGITEPEDYPGGVLAGGETLIKAGERA